MGYLKINLIVLILCSSFIKYQLGLKSCLLLIIVANILLLYSNSQINKIRDSNLIKYKEIDFKFGESYRNIQSDLIDDKGKEFYIKKTHMLTRTISLLIDESNENILICYYNETFPEGETDIFSENKIIDKNTLLLMKMEVGNIILQ
jgi:hypothetical protein